MTRASNKTGSDIDAASGVRMVQRDQMKTPVASTGRPPWMSAILPAGIWVVMYPRKKKDWMRPTVESDQLYLRDMGRMATERFMRSMLQITKERKQCTMTLIEVCEGFGGRGGGDGFVMVVGASGRAGGWGEIGR